MLLDTSGLFCYFHTDEPRHEDAQALLEAAGPKLTQGYVLAEFVALATTRSLPRRQVLDFVRAVMEHPEIEVVWVDGILHERAMQLLESRLDKLYSLCDAISFVLMKDRGLTKALTTDHHFEQEGFRRLLR